MGLDLAVLSGIRVQCGFVDRGVAEFAESAVLSGIRVQCSFVDGKVAESANHNLLYARSYRVQVSRYVG